ncbi:MAG: helix-turn-helix domain-containing protein [Solirubrobacteraceae bacterium]|jgi:excisionase family DNA binding protein
MDETDPATAAPLALTVAQVAQRLGVKHDTVRIWITRGTLRATRPGGRVYRILASDLQAMLDAGDPGFSGYSPRKRDLFTQTPRELEAKRDTAEPAQLFDTPTAIALTPEPAE